MKKSIYILTSLLIISSVSLPVYSQNQTKSETNVNSLEGVVYDSETNLPLVDAYIKQSETLNTVLTNKDGKFNINLNSESKDSLIIGKEGYEDVEIEILSKKKLSVKLERITFFDKNDKSDNNSSSPKVHTDLKDISPYKRNPITNFFSAFYQARVQGLMMPTLDGKSNITMSGIAINEVGLDSQLRFDDYAGFFKVYRSRFPVDIENFSSSTFFIDTIQFQLGAGKVFKKAEDWELYGGLSYLIHINATDNRNSIDNKPIPYTNSFIDFPQTRQGPGLTGSYGRIINDWSNFLGRATLYPVVFTSFEQLSGVNPGYHGFLDIDLGVSVKTLPGIYLTGKFNNQTFFGFSGFLDNASLFNVGISLDPFEMAKASTSGNTDKIININTGSK